jgi:hypothetical protein
LMASDMKRVPSVADRRMVRADSRNERHIAQAARPLHRLIGQEVRHSIIRRSSVVTAAFLFGHGLNYALMLVANRLLGPDGFGLFYTAMLAITVAMAPAMAILFGLGRKFTEMGAVDPRAVAGATAKLVGQGFRIALPIAVSTGGLLALGAHVAGLAAWPIAALLPAVVLSLAATELVRTAFQSLLLFRYSSALWVASQAMQFVLAVGFLAASGRVWLGFLGIFAGAALTLVPFIPWFMRQARAAASAIPPPPFAVGPELPIIASYSLFVLINNVDILLAFFLLPREGLSVYAASALLPKAIVTSTFPIAQIVLPVIVERRTLALSIRTSLLKGLGMALALAGFAVAGLWVLLPVLRSGPMAIRGLDPAVMQMLALGAIGLSGARLLVVTEMALQRCRLAALQAVALFFFVGTSWQAGSLLSFATGYVIVSWVLFVLSLALLVLQRTRGRAMSGAAVT